MSEASALPPGQIEIEDFPRFGWGKFAFRFPPATEGVEIAVGGDVGTPLVVRDELRELPRVEQISDLHCVTTWSKRGLRWSGFRFRDFHQAIVEPRAARQPGADLVVLRSHDGYDESLPLEDLLAADVLLADRLDGRALSIAHGAPIRLVAPAHYGYKNVKHLRSIEFWRDAREYRFAGPRFMDHPRARVALEERGRGVPAWVLRRSYPALIRPIRWLFRVALARHERRLAPSSLRLCRVTRENSSDLMGYAREFADAGESSFVLPGNDPEAFLARVEMFEAGKDLPENRVRMSWFWLLRGDRIVASSRLRHQLIPVLLLDGGNIGYDVRPSERRRGVGRRLLRLTLDEARRIGLRRVLLTTETTNLGSIGVILANGGVFSDTSVSPNTGRTLNRYWIAL